MPETIKQYRADLFLNTVKTLRNGHTQDELSEALNELVQACRETNKTGEITLKIKVRPDKSGNGQYFLEDTFNCKKPESERGQTIYFGTPEGNLQREDPDQKILDLKQVASQAPANTKQLNDTPAQLKQV